MAQKKITQPLRKKKSCNLYPQQKLRKLSYLSAQKKNCTTSPHRKKNPATSLHKKIKQPLWTEKNNATSPQKNKAFTLST